ncbi:MAG: hypothetical protein AAB288_08940 [Acidobacteriota bacterium]
MDGVPPLPNPSHLPTIYDRYAFFRAITPELHGSLPHEEENKSERNAAQMLYNLVRHQSPGSEVLSLAYITITAMFGLDKDGILDMYNGHLKKNNGTFSSNIRADETRPHYDPPRRKETNMLYQDTVIGMISDLRTPADKYYSIMNETPVGTVGKRIQKIAANYIQNQFIWLDNPPAAFGEYEWITWLAAYNFASVLAPAVQLPMPDELEPDSPFMTHPAAACWKRNFGKGTGS